MNYSSRLVVELFVVLGKAVINWQSWPLGATMATQGNLKVVSWTGPRVTVLPHNVGYNIHLRTSYLRSARNNRHTRRGRNNNPCRSTRILTDVTHMERNEITWRGIWQMKKDHKHFPITVCPNSFFFYDHRLTRTSYNITDKFLVVTNFKVILK